MRQETNKEMDLLLRRLGRRDDATVSNAMGDHLDVDELSAYAEQALPPAARARYTAHLAECTPCRELVVQLSASAGVVSAAETAKVSAPSVFGKFLAGLFTPMVLRYAAPALGLIVVAVIGFVVLRRDRAADYVTQVTNNEQRPTPPAVAETAAPAVESPATTRLSREESADREKKNQQTDSPPPPPNAAPVIGIQTEVAKDAAAAQPKQEQQQQPATANEAPPAKPAPTTAPDERRQAAETEVSKREIAASPAASRAPETTLQAQEREDRRTRAFSDEGKATGNVTPQTGGGSKLKRDELNLSANTRSVAGRRFTKKGGVWIDTGYDSSRNAVTLTRGSEQYRALVADEPEIKRIADELDGEIIVVWKGRTYRIR